MPQEDAGVGATPAANEKGSSEPGDARPPLSAEEGRRTGAEATEVPTVGEPMLCVAATDAEHQ